jgi:membrane protein DedA with SNARE-associated domain
VTTNRSRWLRWSLVALLACAVVSTLWFGMRSYRSGLLLRSAYALEAPDLGNIRAWMTLGYISGLYGAPEAALLQRLHLPPDTAISTTIRSLAQQAGVAPLDYVQRVQQAIAAVEPKARRNGQKEAAGWLSAFSDELLAALLVYGYPALAAILVVGSIGVPLPDGLLTAAAGSLIAQHRMAWVSAGSVAVGATVAGDMAGYYLGLILGEEFLKRRGGWIGYTPARRRRVQVLFERWGWVSVLLTRTLASSVSSVVNLMAGASRYRPAAFLGTAVIGRILWTSAYLGLGYGVGGALETANAFLTNVTGVLVSAALCVWAGWLLFRRPSVATTGD